MDGLNPGRTPTERPPEPEIADPDEKPSQPDKKYDELPLTKKEEDKYSSQRSAILAILRAKKFDGNQPFFDDHINRYFLGRWTQWKNVSSLPKYRNELRNYFRQTKGGQVYDRLNVVVLSFMEKLIRGNYSPAVRINAMLAIGELTSGDSAAPLPEAFKTLLDAVGDADLPDALHAAAIVGLARHAQAGIRDENSRRELTEAMLRLATADPPTGPSAAGREWIMAQALDVLGLLGSPGEENKVFKAMTAAVSNDKLSDRTRSAAAAALGRLNYAGAVGIDPLDAALKLARFAADCCADETRLSKEKAQPIPPQRLRQHLDAVLTAIGGADNTHKGIVPLASQPDQKTLLAELQKNIKSLSDQLDSEGKDMGPPVEELSKKLEEWLQKQGGKKATP